MTENLFCPRCGKQFRGETSFCRTCGLALEGVSEIVNGESASAPVMTSQPNFRVMRIGIGLFIFGLAIGLINGAVKDLGLFPESYGKMVFLFLVAAGMLTMGAGFIFPTKKYSKRKPSPSDNEVPAALNTAPLEGQLGPAHGRIDDVTFQKDGREFEVIPVGSVTEQTTRNLDQQAD